MGKPPVLFFGCWNRAGHFLHVPGGQSNVDRVPEYYGAHIHLDGSLAPRRGVRGRYRDVACVWQGSGANRIERDRIGYDTDEYPQGQFLLHHLSTGYTAIQWWDRCQGDTRGACNSTMLLAGQRTAEEVIAALWVHFPHVIENLVRGGPVHEKYKQAPVLSLDYIDPHDGNVLMKFATVR